MFIFINNRICSSDEPTIHASDRGFLLGGGIFETLKVVNGSPLSFERHYNRLKRSAEKLGIPLQYSSNEILDICKELLRLNNTQSLTASIRITLTRGQAPRGIAIPKECNPTLLVTTAAYVQDHDIFPKLFVTNIKRNELSLLSQLKILNYLEPILTKKIAIDNGFDDGIMLNTKGAITESSVANLFFVKNGIIKTPRIEDGVFPGIVREVVIECCKASNLPFLETEIMPEEALTADEVFQTNSLIELQAVSSINNHLLNPMKFVVLEKLVKTYKDLFPYPEN